jgi:hypothetical protein
MTTIQKLEADIESIKNQVGHVSHNHRAAYVNREALKAVLVEAENQILFELVNHPTPEPLHIPNSTNHPFCLLQSPAFQGYTTNRIVLDLFEATPAWKEAHGILQPLVDQLAEAEQKLADEVATRGAMQNALREAEEQALEQAKAAALESPAVVAARNALAALEKPSKTKRQPADSIG